MKVNSQICDEISVKINSQISYIKRAVQPAARKLQLGWTVEEVRQPDVIVVSDKEPIIIELSVSLCVNLWGKKSNLTFEKWVEHQNGLVIGWLANSRQIKFTSDQDYLMFVMKYL